MDGKALAGRRLERLAQQVAGMSARPGYALVTVGADAPARRYARYQQEACEVVGLHFQWLDLLEQLSTAQVSREVVKLGQHAHLHGIVLQHPFPETVDYHEVTRWLPPEKDVDACHPLSQADLFRPESEPLFWPAAAAACLALLEAAGVTLAGAQVAVLGLNPVARTAGVMLVRREASVDASPDAERTAADIVLAGFGVARGLKGSMIKAGAAVVDLGAHRRGAALVGDVDVASVEPVAGVLTPVPGGVGPMTLAVLMEQTVQAASRA